MRRTLQAIVVIAFVAAFIAVAAVINTRAPQRQPVLENARRDAPTVLQSSGCGAMSETTPSSMIARRLAAAISVLSLAALQVSARAADTKVLSALSMRQVMGLRGSVRGPCGSVPGLCGVTDGRSKPVGGD